MLRARLVSVVASCLLASCGASEETASSGGASGAAVDPDALVAEGPHDVAVVRVAELGDIRFELLPEIAPGTVENFVKLAGDGFAINARKLDRNFSEPYEPDESVQAAWFAIYRDPEKYFELYELAEKLVDIEDAFQNWRFKHMYTVQRIIGSRPGTGGSSGVPFLKKAIETSFFPELFAIRTDL